MLLEIKDTLSGTDALFPPNWGDTDSSNNLIAFASWTGITTSGTGADARVTRINLPAKGLNGKIPAAIGSLTGLTGLILYNNSGLTGEIPDELGNLTNLTDLRLYSTPGEGQLSGPIPKSLGNLTSLVTLRLNGNQLSGAIPAELGKLTNLTDLRLEENQLSGAIPTQLGDLTNLTRLYLGRNPLTPGPMPAWIYGLTNLQHLRMQDVGLTSISSSLTSLSSLSTLWLHENTLKGELPSWLGSMTSLRDLDLSYNGFSGSIPQEFSALTDLDYFYVRGNQLTGTIPSFVGGFTGLYALSLEDNQFTGGIPDVSGLTELEVLNLSGNRLSGGIPVGLALAGSDPSAFGIGINLSNNRLTGGIPSQLGSLTNLYSLRLSSNLLAGSIPGQLGSLSNLVTLDLSYNRLSGSIPSELGSLGDGFLTLDLSDNRLSGSIPSELGSLTDLETLDLSSNRLAGSIPSELAPTATSGLGLLKVLRLHHNDLTGELPLGIQYESGHTPLLQSLEGLSLDPEQIGADGMSVSIAAKVVYLDLPEDPTPDSADPERTYVSWRFIDRLVDVDGFDDLNQIRVPVGTVLDAEEDREFYQVSLKLFDTLGNPIVGTRMSEPATVCVPDWDGMADTMVSFDQHLLELTEGSATWRPLPYPDTDPTIGDDSCGLTRYLGTFVVADGPPGQTTSPTITEFKLTAGPDGGGSITLLDDVQVNLNLPAGSVANGEQVEFTIRRASKPSPGNFAVSDNPVVVEITLAEGELLLPVTVCLPAVQDLEEPQALLRLGDGPAAQWEALPRVFPPAGYDSSEWVCGSTRDFSFFTVGVVHFRSTLAYILRIEPSIRSVTVSQGDTIHLSFDVYGRQNILNNDLGEGHVFTWDDGGAGGSFRTDRPCEHDHLHRS